jgi:predicted  nucleic acid-binding Zn-ribbon protein
VIRGGDNAGGAVTVREELAGYVALQRLLQRRIALQREREIPPDELTTLRTRFSERREALVAAQQRREALAKEQSGLQKDGEALREEREHFRKQKSMVTNMKQLAAVVSELDHVEVQLKAKDDRLIEIMEELDRLDKSIVELDQETPEERAAREEAEAAWEVRRKAADEELVGVERSLKDVQIGLGRAAVERFKKLWTSRRPLAVVPMEGSSCSACHAELRPAVVQVVRAVDALQHCDTCRRLLYDPEQFQ